MRRKSIGCAGHITAAISVSSAYLSLFVYVFPHSVDSLYTLCTMLQLKATSSVVSPPTVMRKGALSPNPVTMRALCGMGRPMRLTQGQRMLRLISVQG